MAFSFFGRRSQMRIYDGTSGGTPPGPFYLALAFEQMNFRGPFGRPRPNQILKMNRGLIDTDAHFIIADDSPIAEPVPISFTVSLIDTLADNLIDALSNPLRETPWTVGNQTWTNTNGSTNLINGDGTTVAVPDTADTTVDRVNLEIRYIATTGGANDLVLRFNEIWFPPNQLEIGMAIDDAPLTITGLMFGNVVKATAFTTGTDTTA